MPKSKTASEATWDLTPLLKNDNDPKIASHRKQVEQQTAAFVRKWSKNQNWLSDPKVLRQTLDDYEKWLANYGESGPEGYYFWMRTAQNETDPKLKAKLNQVTNFGTKIANQMQFFPLRLSQISSKQQKVFLSSPSLANYRHWLEQLFAEAKHVLSEAEEKIISLKAAPSHHHWVQMTSTFLADEQIAFQPTGQKGESLNFNQLLQKLSHPKQSIRDLAAKHINIILAKHADVAEHELNAILHNKQIDDDLRSFTRPDASRHLGDDVESNIVDTLSDTVAKAFGIAHRYYKLKAKLLGKKQLAYHDRNADIGDLPWKFTFPESKKLLLETFDNLDPELANLADRFFAERRVDIFPYPGKSGGAFCAHHLKSQPIYLMLNFDGRLEDVLTMAHEFGHGLHYELIKRSQNALNFSVSLSVAEVASTFMEDFVLQALLQKADEQTRLKLLLMKLNSDISTIFRQIACYQFEQDLHKEFRAKGYLDKKAIGQLFQNHMRAYMGKAVEQSAGAENWWVYWGHIRNFFYNYSYAGGLLISKSLQAKVKADPAFIHQVKQAFSVGSSLSPQATFQQLGIDITKPVFWQAGLKEINSLLTEAEKVATKLTK